MIRIILLLMIAFLAGCATLDKSNPSEIIVKDGMVNLSHITEAKTLERGKLK